MYSICQRCGGDATHHWNVQQAEFHVGRIDHWKVQLCNTCTPFVEQTLLVALRLDRAATTRIEVPDA